MCRLLCHLASVDTRTRFKSRILPAILSAKLSGVLKLPELDAHLICCECEAVQYSSFYAAQVSYKLLFQALLTAVSVLE